MVNILTSSELARYRRAAIMVVAQTSVAKQRQYSTMPALVAGVAAKVGESRESGSMPPATMRISDITSGIYNRSRTHCMRRPFGPEVIFSMLAVDMKSGVNPISVRMATPVSKVVFVSFVSGNMTVAARSSATLIALAVARLGPRHHGNTWVRRHRDKMMMHIHGKL